MANRLYTILLRVPQVRLVQKGVGDTTQPWGGEWFGGLVAGW